MKIIAEIGWNFLGDMDLADKMIAAAAQAGADYAKFQTWSVKKLKAGPWDTDGRREIYEKAELDADKHLYLYQRCNQHGIRFLTSAFEAGSVNMIRSLSADIKIPSTELFNTELLNSVNLLSFDNVFLSTGTCQFDEIHEALKKLNYIKKIYLLHCVTSYPCLAERVNLPRIRRLRDAFESNRVRIGYSGHGFGIWDAIGSVEYDVEVIEKHFTIDKELPGRDNKFALLPNEMSQLCSYVEAREEMNLYHWNDYQECEQEAREVYRGRWNG